MENDNLAEGQVASEANGTHSYSMAGTPTEPGNQATAEQKTNTDKAIHRENS